jgi:hypothetical protein
MDKSWKVIVQCYKPFFINIQVAQDELTLGHLQSHKGICSEMGRPAEILDKEIRENPDFLSRMRACGRSTYASAGGADNPS